MRRNLGDGHSKYLQSVIEYEKYIPSNFFHSDFLTFFFFFSGQPDCVEGQRGCLVSIYRL